jgi:serine/threonine protein kinase
MPGGSVENIIQRFGRLSECTITCYTEQLLAGLAYLHSERVIHYDIKGANLLVDNDGVVNPPPLTWEVLTVAM